jgi:hypothetical protein
MDQKLNIYECEEIIRKIETQAEMNDGELSDDDMQAIVLAQTQSIEQLGKLVNYILYLESFDVIAKAEVERIQTKRKVASNRVENIKRWLLPYVEKHGPVTVGIRRIVTRKSQGVVLADGFENPQYGLTNLTKSVSKKVYKTELKYKGPSWKIGLICKYGNLCKGLIYAKSQRFKTE